MNIVARLLLLSFTILIGCRDNGDENTDDTLNPIISSIEPSSASAGVTVIVNGDHFAGLDSTEVYFVTGEVYERVKAKVTGVSAKVITVKVPDSLYRWNNVYVKRGNLGSKVFDVHNQFTFISPCWDIRPGVNLGQQSASFSIGAKAYFMDAHGPLSSYDTTTGTLGTPAQLDRAFLLTLAFATDTQGIVVLDNYPYGEVWAYDPIADTWTQRANCPYVLHFGSFTFRIGSKVYLSGGSRHEFYSYDGSTDTWAKLADYPGINGEGAKAIAVDGIGYCFQGGWDLIQQNGTTYTSFNNYNGNWKYDPATDQWTALPPVPDVIADRSFGIIVSTGDRIYFGSGYSQLFFETEPGFNHMYYYSVSNNSWTKSELLPYQMNNEFFSCTIGDKAYAMEMQGLHELYIFKPNKN